jgi:superfamily II DNA or RNA helicase
VNERIQLDEDQLAAVERMVNEPTRAALNGSLYGTGKTVVTVEVAAALGGAVNVIVCPIFTRLSWRDTILRQYNDADVAIIDSTVGGKRALADLQAGIAGWYIVGREFFATKGVQEALRLKWKYIDFLAYDECQKWANRKSAGFRMMKNVKPGYKMALSATPFGNRFQNMYAITKWLWPDLYGGFWNWANQWCEFEYDAFAGTVPTGEKKPGEYVNSLPCYVRIEAEFDEPREYEVEIKLSPAERKIYDQFEKSLIVWLGDNPLIGKLPSIKRLRLREMTLGEVTIDPEIDRVYYPDDMKSTKYETLTSLIDEYGSEPALIFTHSQKYAEVVARRLQKDGYRAVEWSGKISEKVRSQQKIDFEEGRIDYMVATPGSIGEGTDGLQHRARLMIWLSRDDNNMLNQQAFRRLYRRGQTKQVISVDIVAEKTYDRGQLSSLIEQQLKNNESLKLKRDGV